MAALSERKILIVRTLVEAAPDRVVGTLQQALAGTAAESALGGVRRLVETEVFDRNLRNCVLSPIAPMCVGAGDSKRALTFPSRALGLLWRGLCAVEAEAVGEARDNFTGEAPPPMLLGGYDHLTAVAAAGLRERSTPQFAGAAEACEQARPGGAEQLAQCLDIAPIARRAIYRLPEWISHAGGDTTAAARLAYKDAVAIAEDAGPRFFEMLAAQMAEPWMVLRVISAVMDKPTDRYMHDSELASFGENLLSDVDQSLHDIASLNPDDGPEAGRAAARIAELVVQQVLEMENSIELNREQGWGVRVHKQRVGLASVVEGRFREGEKAVAEALVMHVPRGARNRRQSPRLDTPPEARPVNRAMTLLSFCDELRTTANYGGFSSTRAKTVEKVSEYIANYVEEVLDHVRTGDVEDLEIAEAFLGVAADFNGLVLGDKAGELIRRRAHAALHPEHHHAGSDG